MALKISIDVLQNGVFIKEEGTRIDFMPFSMIAGLTKTKTSIKIYNINADLSILISNIPNIDVDDLFTQISEKLK